MKMLFISVEGNRKLIGNFSEQDIKEIIDSNVLEDFSPLFLVKVSCLLFNKMNIGKLADKFKKNGNVFEAVLNGRDIQTVKKTSLPFDKSFSSIETAKKTKLKGKPFTNILMHTLYTSSVHYSTDKKFIY